MKRKLYTIGSSVRKPKSTANRKRRRQKCNINEDPIPSTSRYDVSYPYPSPDSHVRLGNHAETINIEDENSDEEKLYKESRITFSEGILLILGFVIKHKLTRKGTQDLISLLNQFLPKNCHLLSSYVSLVKKIPKSDSIRSHHYYCSECSEYLDQETYFCAACKSCKSQESLWDRGSFFTKFDIASSIESILKDQHVANGLWANLLKRNSDNNGVLEDIMDRRFLQYSVPYSYDRPVRSLTERKFWKASELRTWTIASGRVLHNILPQLFLSHFLKFVNALMLLSKKFVTQVDIQAAKELILQFTMAVEGLYGEAHCSYNIHLLTHAPTCVENWGPLWAYSAFQYESYNAVLLRMCNGKQKIGVEISNQISTIHSAMTWSRKLNSTEAIKMFQRMCRNIPEFQSSIEVSSILFYGQRNCYYLNQDDRSNLSKLGVNHIGNLCYTYKKCRVNGIIYNTVLERSRKKCNYLAEITGSIFIIEKILALSPNPVCIVRKVQVKQHKEYAFAFQVTSQAERTAMKLLSSCNSKYLCSRNGKNLLELIKLPNSIENE